MKSKLISCLLLLLLLLPAILGLAEDGIRGYSKAEGYVYLTLGSCPQAADGAEAPILWRVLSADEEKAYILSEYILFAHRIDGDYKAWEKSKGDFAATELCGYMNGEFAEKAFAEEELSLLLERAPYGRLFLAESDDLKNAAYGFSANKDRKAWGTEYAIADDTFGKALFVYSRKEGKCSPYWTMTQSTTNRQGARCTKQDGSLGYINVITLNEGCRPAAWLDMTKAVIRSGAGTMEDPYTIGINEE